MTDLNTLHCELAPGTWWTTNNMREAIPGVPTPLTWSIWEYGSLLGCADMVYRLGTATAEEAPVLARRGFSIVHGRPVACINFTMSLMSRMPGADPEAFTHAIFGVPIGTIEYEPLPPLGPDAAERHANTAATQVESTRRIADEIRAEWEQVLHSPPQRADALQRLQHGVELYRRIYTEHLVMTSLSLAVFGEVAALAARAGLPGFERRLVTGYGGVEETEIAEDLWHVAHDTLALGEFLRRHGYHGPNEGEVAAPSWRETPDAVRSLVGRYRDHDSEDPHQRQQRQRVEREHSERQLLDSVPDAEREPAESLLARAQSWIPAREVGKGGFLMGLDVVRAAARVLGAELAERGAIAEPDHVFMFTFRELADLPPNSKDLAIERDAQRRDYLTTDVPPIFEGTPARIPLGVAEHDAREVRGVPVSPGVVTGPARVIVDPTDATPVEPGEILVCETTDPSWVSLFLDAAALVIDIGQVMSHGAIVARELGIPCVIDTKNGTRRLRDGMTIEVDGDTGIVRVLERTPQSTTSAHANA